MALKEIKLKATSEVKIEIEYTSTPGPILAVYNYDLKSDDANPPIEHHKGDNQNSQDDKYSLPTPVINNKGRFILISSELAAIGSDADFEIAIRIIQDDKKPEALTITGKVEVNGDSVNKLAMIKFI